MYKTGRRVVPGDKVVRGPDWNDGEGTWSYDGKQRTEGTVISAEAGMAVAKFECSSVFAPRFKMGRDAIYHLQSADGPRVNIEAAETACLEVHRANIGAMLADPEFSDVTVRCGRSTFRANAAVIAAHSEKLRAAMRRSKKCGGDGRRQLASIEDVEVVDMKPDILQVVLIAMYTGSVESAHIEPESFMDLFAASEHYKMGKLNDLVRFKMIENGLRFYNLSSGKKSDDLDAAEKAFSQHHLKKIGAIFGDDEFSDVDLVCGGATIRAHKAILAAHSDVFYAMFKKDSLLEAATNRLVVTDINEEVLETLIYSIYNGCLDPKVVPEMLMELFSAADKYNVAGVRSLCEEHILQQFHADLRPEVVTEALAVARLHSSAKIKTAAIARK